MALEVRRKPWERFSTVRQNAYARLGDIEDLSIDTFNINITANEDLIDIRDSSNVFTSAQFIDVDLGAYVSGSLIDIDLGTSTITADSAIIDIWDSRDHDDLATDNYFGLKFEMSGDFLGAFASYSSIVWAAYTGEIDNSAELYCVVGDLNAATLTGGTYAAGFFRDPEVTVLLADGTSGVDITPDADTVAITIDAGTTDHTGATIINADVDVNSADCDFISATIDVGTALSGAEIVRGSFFDMNPLAADADTSGLIGYDVLMTAISTSRSDLLGYKVAFDGTMDTADTITGILVDGSALTVDDTALTLHGIEVAFASVTDTDFTSGEFNAIDITMPAALHATDTSSAIKATGDGNQIDILTGINGTVYGITTDAPISCTANAGTAGTNCTVVEFGDGINFTTYLSLTNVVLGAPTAGGNSAHGALIYTFPAGVHFHEVTYMSVGLTVGTVTTDTPDTGIGSLIGSGANALLANVGATAEDYITGTAAADCAGTPLVLGPLGAVAGIHTGISLNAAGDTKAVNFNAADGWNAGVTGNLTATGVVVLKWTIMG